MGAFQGTGGQHTPAKACPRGCKMWSQQEKKVIQRGFKQQLRLYPLEKGWGVDSFCFALIGQLFAVRSFIVFTIF